MALYDDILENKNKKVNSANVKENKVFGNTAPVNNFDYTIYPYENYVNEVNNTLNTRWDTYMKSSQYVDQDIQGAGMILETEDEPITHQCEINTSGDNYGHISDPTGIPIVTTKDITCRTSFFSIDLGVKVYQEDDWYFPIVQHALNGGCIQCNNNVGCEKCNGCYNTVYTGSECPTCNGACTSGCTSGCTSANTAGMCANCDAGCVGCDNCNAGCTTACTSSCVDSCTEACTDCDLEYTWENPDTGETCIGCDNCTSCDSCDSCVGSNVDHEIYWCSQCDSHCFGCDGSCNTCTNCTSCNGNVTQEQCKNDTSCQSACTNGCAEGCTTAQVSTCIGCNGGCNGTCQNNQNGVGDGCKTLVSEECYQNVDCHGTISLFGGCKKGVVTCDNNNAYDVDTCLNNKYGTCAYEVSCENGVSVECSLSNVSMWCNGITDWVSCFGNCNTGSYGALTCDTIVGNCWFMSVSDITQDPICNDCNGSCTTCDGCVTSCNESCNGCDTCNGCVGCDGGCASCNGCTSACQNCTATCVSGCASGCASCVGSSCVSCVDGCYSTCASCTSCASETGCSNCTGSCQSCTSCDGCASATSCSGCTSICQTCDSEAVCTTCARSCTNCNGNVS